MPTPRRPNLFIVGAARCGTAALWRYLGAHPQVLMSRKKEPTYFGSDLRMGRFTRPTLPRYLENFSGKEGAVWLGEASVFYLLSTRAAAEIKAFDPEARIIISLRNPADLLYSLHHIAVYQGQEDIRDFASALAAMPRRRRGESIPRGVLIHDALDYDRVARLSEQVARYLDVFDAGQVKILLLDDLRADTAGVYRGVLEFLGIDTNFQPDLAVVNACRRLRSPGLRRLLKRVQGATARFLGQGSVPDRACRRLLRPVDQWNLAAPRPIDQALRDRLIEELAPEVERLGALIGRDLSHWSRPGSSMPARP